jgi:predicted amidohydrolase YtcJ
MSDGLIGATGTGDGPAADRMVELDGGYLIPALRDGHAHLPSTGLHAAGMDLRGVTSSQRILEGLASASENNGILYGAGFEEPLDGPLTRHEIDDVVGDGVALLARADLHSSIVSSALLDKIDLNDLGGVDRDERGHPTGFLREQASSEAWRVFDASIPHSQQREILLDAVKIAYSKGIAELHEMFVVDWRGWGAAERFLEVIDEVSLNVPIYFGTDDVERVFDMGFRRIGGDWFLDGSFGSHTAWLNEPYVSEPPDSSTPTGIRYRSDDEVFELFLRAAERGMQAGVHAIGDAAIDQAIDAWERVADRLGSDTVFSARNRIEHFECATDDHIKRSADLGLIASVQPAFDRYWGGEDGLYSSRIGWDRARLMNRFATMQGAGLHLGGGSDSTVTPLDPFLAMASLRNHHAADESVSASAALAIMTTGVAGLAPDEGARGLLSEGHWAEMAWVDRDPLDVDSEELLDTRVLGTWVHGQRVWPEAESEAS